MSTRRLKPYVPRSHMPKGPGGRRLCRWCGKEVEYPRRTFCSDQCIHEHRLRSDVGYMRAQVFKRDNGVCAMCGVDTKQLYHKLRDLYHSDRPEFTAILRELNVTLHRYQHSSPHRFWDADHIVPVVEGGGECGMENIRTLCIKCHKEETAQLLIRRSEERQNAKRAKQLLREVRTASTGYSAEQDSDKHEGLCLLCEAEEEAAQDVQRTEEDSQ